MDNLGQNMLREWEYMALRLGRIAWSRVFFDLETGRASSLPVPHS
jgi:hypothetical protein